MSDELKEPLEFVDYAYVLGIQSTALPDGAKKAHRKAIVKWHPDKFAMKSEEMKDYANNYSQNVNKAIGIFTNHHSKDAKQFFKYYKEKPEKYAEWRKNSDETWKRLDPKGEKKQAESNQQQKAAEEEQKANEDKLKADQAAEAEKVRLEKKKQAAQDKLNQ